MNKKVNNKELAEYLQEELDAVISSYIFAGADAQDPHNNKYHVKITYFIATITKPMTLYYDLMPVVANFYHAKTRDIGSWHPKKLRQSLDTPEHFFMTFKEANRIIEVYASQITPIMPKQIIFNVVDKELVKRNVRKED